MTRLDKKLLAQKYLESWDIMLAAELAGIDLSKRYTQLKISRLLKNNSFLKVLAREGRSTYLRTLWLASQGQATRGAVLAARALAIAAGADPSQLPGGRGEVGKKPQNVDPRDNKPEAHPKDATGLEWE